MTSGKIWLVDGRVKSLNVNLVVEKYMLCLILRAQFGLGC